MTVEPSHDHHLSKLVDREQGIFKYCPMCGFRWESKDAFFDDTSLEYNGQYADQVMLGRELHFFTHAKKECGSTLCILLEKS